MIERDHLETGQGIGRALKVIVGNPEWREDGIDFEFVPRCREGFVQCGSSLHHRVVMLTSASRCVGRA